MTSTATASAEDRGVAFLDSLSSEQASLEDRVSEQLEQKKPKPLPDSLPPVIDFNPEMLPDELRSYVLDVARRLQCPPEYCAVAALVLLAGLVGHKVRLRPKQHDDWEIVVILWGMLVGGPSSMKTPAIKTMRFPIDAIEADARKQHKEAVAGFKEESELAEIAKAAAKKKAKSQAEKGDMDGAKATLQAVETPEEPGHAERLLAQDATVEALGELMNRHAHNLTVLRDELSGLLAKLQQEENASERAFYLESFEGTDRFTVDRIGRGEVVIERCALNIVGGIQPSKLAPLVQSASKGTVNDGLVQRFQLAVWPDPVKEWKWIDRAPDPRAKERFSQAFYRLHSLDLGTDEDGNPPFWRFTPDAQALFVEWMTEINLECRSGSLSPLMAEHLLKMPKTVGSLALLFALIDGDSGEVGRLATARALEWADYLRSHAERLYSAATNRDVDGAKLILKRRNKLPNPFKAKQVQQRGWAALDTTAAAQGAIDLLVEYGYLTEVETPTAGRPRLDYWWHSDYAPEEDE